MSRPLPELPVLPGPATSRDVPTPDGAVAERDAALGRLPHVVAWNLTRRCNLACAHCYIAAGDWHARDDDLTTAECRRIADEILALNPGAMFVLSGGEPLLRDDLEAIAEHATAGGATVVVGTNGTLLTDERTRSLRDAGVRGFAVSVDSLDPRYHDRFRHGGGALRETLAAADRVAAHGLDFIVQMTVTRGNRTEVADVAAWAAERGAVAFNVYFLVATGRGEGMRGLEPAENEAVLTELVELERRYRGRMMVRSKCNPQIMRHVVDAAPDSPLLNYETRCPCGVHYCRITPEGRVTPCPYTPAVAGDLRSQSFETVWWGSPVLRALRDGEPGGKCGRCEYREVCGGCRARAHAETGDLLAEDASCAYEPAGGPLVRPRRDAAYGRPARPELDWDDEARARMDRIPSFVRGVVTRRVEAFARERGIDRVTVGTLDEVRRSMPVDSSGRKPFFLRGE
ncbi:MAG: radical SAM protein [Gemmatimonadetes bacterium]|nr:radical SAM protein [Gemmatimonadota bacterium]NIQ55920.1 radical SAM protein [Gemmatimonadota bacterium]NIU76118.1 radical SAM protein [Gammaproteobacteria bacterium]NIX45668.1 radical SAM protein [Gemmatimonadota bacterium]NIY09969.1 radical SAM protein [Gemmatimonadota bacterium]